MKKLIWVLFPFIVALTGCANTQKMEEPRVDKNPTIYSDYNSKTFNPKATPTIQTDRYTLVELDDPIHKYVLDQIIDISIPKNLSLSVKDGMNYLLNQSGYSLCDNSDITILYQSPLPKIHYKMGPIKLGNAIQIMSGPAWKLLVDDVDRTICFELAEGYHKKITQSVAMPSVALEPVQSSLNDSKTTDSTLSKPVIKVINVTGKKNNSDSGSINTTQRINLSQIKKLEPKDDCKE